MSVVLFQEARGGLPLDTFAGSVAAYSTSRKLRTAYAGPAIRVRRSSDNAEQDVLFNFLGALDEDMLLSFVGAGDGFITTLYDNTGNSNNAIQPTAANQPQIVSAGSIIKENGRPVARFNGLTAFMNMPSLLSALQNVPFAQCFVALKFLTATEDASQAHPVHFSIGVISQFQGPRFNLNRQANVSFCRALFRRLDANSDSNANTNGISTTGTNLNVWSLFADYADTGLVSLRKNQEARASSTLPTPVGNTSNVASGVARLGAGSDGGGNPTFYFEGSLSEFILYNTPNDYLTREVSVTANQMAYYSI